MRFKLNILTADDVEVVETGTEHPISSLMNEMHKIYSRLHSGEAHIITVERIDDE